MTDSENYDWRADWEQRLGYDAFRDTVESSLDEYAKVILDSIEQLKKMESERLQELFATLLERKEKSQRELEERYQERENNRSDYFSGDVAQLNVGGEVFSLSVASMIKRESFFGLFVTGEICLPLDENGVMFLDRDPKYFQDIISYLDGGMDLFKQNAESYTARDRYLVSHEARYYGLFEIEDYLQKSLGFTYAQGEKNVLMDAASGGTAKAIYYLAKEGAGELNSGTLEGTADNTTSNNGMLITHASDVDNHPYYSFRTNSTCGTVWTNGAPGVSVGELIIDLTGVDYNTRYISTFSAFQMHVNGKCSHIRISKYPLSATKPTADDDKWEVVTDDWVLLNEYTYASPLELGRDVTGYMRRTALIVVPTFTTRYLRVECKNDGTLGDSERIGLRQLKAFG